MRDLRESVVALARQASQPAPDSLSDIRLLIDSFETQREQERLLEFILRLRAVPPTGDEHLANLKREARKVLSDQSASRDAVDEFALVRQFVLSPRELDDMERYGPIATQFGFSFFAAVIQGLIAADTDGEEERIPQTPATENDDVPKVETPVEPEAREMFEEPEKLLRIISNPVEKLAAKEITKENKWAKGMSRHFLPIKLLGFMGIASARQMGLAIGDKALNQSIEYLKKEGYLGEAAFNDDAFSEEPLYFLASKGQGTLTNANCLAALEKYRILQKSERKKLLLFNPDELSAVSRSLYHLNDFWNDAFFSRLSNPCLWIETNPKTETPFLVAEGALSETQPLICLFAEANEQSEAALSPQYSEAVRIWISSDEQAAAWAARHKSDFTVFWRAPGIVREVLPDGDAVCEDTTVTQFIEALLAEVAEKSHAPVSEQTEPLPANEAGQNESADMPVSDDKKRVVDETLQFSPCLNFFSVNSAVFFINNSFSKLVFFS